MAESIHLVVFPKPDAGLKDDELAAKWETLISVRAEVTKALEQARADKGDRSFPGFIGHPRAQQ
jgi:isoleucyl-tRNA synthetase